jgi:hypothetical protein
VNARVALVLAVCAWSMSASIPSAAANPVGNACSASSGKTAPPVIELYTSEGCDSCPPADRWFSTLKDDAARGKVVPLAFHVDYWDYLGWRDRFGDPLFSARHRDAAARGGARVVYTPQMLLDGREFMQWRRTGWDQLGTSAAPKPARAELRVSAAAAPASIALRVNVSGKTVSAMRGGEAYVALFENGLSSDVKGGENKGVLLRHEVVVRRWLGPFAFERGELNVAQAIEIPANAVLAQSGIAVVAVDDRGGVLQAVALPLRDCGG